MAHALINLLDKKSDFSELKYDEQVKYMAFVYTRTNDKDIFNTKNLVDTFDTANLPKPKNMSNYVAHLIKKKVFIKKIGGYAISREENKKLEDEFEQNAPSVKISHTLRNLAQKTISQEEKEFLQEAISCFEINAYRATIVLVWLMTIDRLYNYVFSKNLAAFNQVLSKQNKKIQSIKKREDFNEIGEGEFITISRSAGIINNDQRKILEEKLGIRNTAAHPNTTKISEAKCMSFVEDLVDNILVKFQ